MAIIGGYRKKDGLHGSILIFPPQEWNHSSVT